MFTSKYKTHQKCFMKILPQLFFCNYLNFLINFRVLILSSNLNLINYFQAYPDTISTLTKNEKILNSKARFFSCFQIKFKT